MMTFLGEEKKTPFDATKAGLIVNTILGLPRAAGHVAKDIGRGITRNVASAGLTVSKKFGGADQVAAENVKSLFGQELWRNTFGDEPIEAIEDRVVKAESKVKNNEIARKFGLDKFATPLAFAGIMGSVGLDLTPFGGLEKNVAKNILKETTEEGAFQIAKKLGATDDVAKIIAPVFASTKTEREATKALEVFKSMRGVKELSSQKVVEPLVQEARKYKSAEEFVEFNTPKVYRGQFAVEKGIPREGLSTTLDFNQANKYAKARGIGGEKQTYYLNPNAKKISLEDVPNEVRGLEEGTDFAGKAAIWARKQGYDILDMSKGNEAEIRILTENAFTTEAKTKSQLTDIWNKANKKVNHAEYDEGYFKRKPTELPENLEQKRVELEIRREELNNSPYNNLTKFQAKSGEFKGRLPEVTGTGKGKFSRRGDDVITESLGDVDSETAREGFENFVKSKKALREEEIAFKEAVKLTKQTKVPEGSLAKSPSVQLAETSTIKAGSAEARSLQKLATEALGASNQGGDVGGLSLPRSIQVSQTPVKSKVHLLDYIRTPDRVLAKIGLGNEAKFLREQYDIYIKELPKNVEKITEWSKQVPKESNSRIFKWLDGQAVDLNDKELRVGNEIKGWLAEWADRLGLPKDKRIAEYITHIFDDQLVRKEFDEDLAKIIRDKIPGSVYDPFLLKRLGGKGYIEDTWKALDAYVKRATRKVHLDPALSKIESKAASFEESQWNYVKSYLDGVNMRPKNVDNLLDNGIKSMIGYKFGQRPTLAVTRFLRQMTYRAMLGLNVSSALKNLSQGINTYAKLGEKYTVVGYSKLFSSKAREELVKQGVLNHGFIQDRTLSATGKVIQKADDALFFFFENAERINRSAAYFGAKAKALAKGESEEAAIKFAKKIVRDTQFNFGSVDTPVFLQSDVGKTLGQFQSFTTKQVEFLTEMVKNKEVAGLMRYAVAGTAFVYTVGQAFGMEPKDLIPIWRIGTPPSLKLPVEVGKAVLDAPDKYGKDRDMGKKVSDIGKSALGLVPAGTQIKKTVQGLQAVNKGYSETKGGKKQFEVGGSLPKNIQAIIFGKYANKEAKSYFNPEKKSKKTMSF